MSLYNIKTEAGKVLWEKINQEQGSAVWGAVGQGIEAIEAEVEARIIKLLEEHAEQEFADNYARDDGTYHEDVCNLCAKWNGLGVAIALIKGEREHDNS